MIRIERVKVSRPVVHEALEDVDNEQQLAAASSRELLRLVEYTLEGVLIKDGRFPIRTARVVARSVEVAKVGNILPQPRVKCVE